MRNRVGGEAMDRPTLKTQDTRRIMVIDDQPVVRTAIRSMLSGQRDVHLSEASDACEALDYLHGSLPNLILCDIGMADGNGFDFLQSMRCPHHTLFHIPIIFLTGNADVATVRKASEMGVDGYVLKTSATHKVGEAIEKVMLDRFGAYDPARMRVLVVDDEPFIRSMIRATLNKLGCQQVAEASSGSQAVQILRSALPSLILSDVNMPKGDGFLFLKNLRRHKHPVFNIPVVMLTSDSSEKTVKTALTFKVDGYLVKPVSQSKLLSKIEDVLGRAAQ